MAKILVKIPVLLPSRVVADRDMHGEKKAYQTNRRIKLADTWLILKSLTTSGKIQDIKSRAKADLVAEICKISRQTLFARINALEEVGLLQLQRAGSRADLVIAKWSRFFSEFLLDARVQQFYTIEYDTEEKKQSLEYVIRALEIERNRDRQYYAIMAQLQNNPEHYVNLCKLIQKFFPGTNPDVLSDVRIFCELVTRMQEISFQSWTNDHEGSEYVYRVIHSVNTDVSRSAKGLRKAHAYKSCLSTTYLKRALSQRGLAKIEKRKRILSETRRRKSKASYTSWDAAVKNTAWHLPDQIITKVPHFSPKAA